MDSHHGQHPYLVFVCHTFTMAAKIRKKNETHKLFAHYFLTITNQGKRATNR